MSVSNTHSKVGIELNSFDSDSDSNLSYLWISDDDGDKTGKLLYPVSTVSHRLSIGATFIVFSKEHQTNCMIWCYNYVGKEKDSDDDEEGEDDKSASVDSDGDYNHDHYDSDGGDDDGDHDDGPVM